MKDLQQEIKFALAEQLMLETIFEHASKDDCTKLATEIAKFIKDKDCKAPDIVGAIYMIHSMHVKEAMMVLDENSKKEIPSKQQIPPWMQ